MQCKKAPDQPLSASEIFTQLQRLQRSVPLQIKLLTMVSISIFACSWCQRLLCATALATQFADNRQGIFD